MSTWNPRTSGSGCFSIRSAACSRSPLRLISACPSSSGRPPSAIWKRAHTVAHMKAVENRHFMLSDLFDYIHLVKTMGAPGISAGGSPFHWLHDGLSNVEACLWIMMILDPVEPKS